MAKRFVRIDLSADARDFQTVAVEPGIPFLDKANANYRVLHKWLGRLVAEPEWHGNSVDLFVCDDQQGRLNDVHCESATAEDFARSRELRQDLEELARRLKQVKPEPKEVKLHEATVRHFQKAASESSPSQKECCFFKYRDGSVWRLVWGWGYQRKDLAPAQPMICTNPNCSHLFVRYRDGDRTCPACEKGPEHAAGVSPRRRLRTAALLALLLLVAAAIGYGLRGLRTDDETPPASLASPLQAEPAEWTGPAGGQLQYRVTLRGPDGSLQDVTSQVLAVAEDPKILRIDRFGTTARALATGRTPVYFYLADKVAHATVEVQPPRNPDRLRLEPDQVTLGPGTTARIRAWGEFADGVRIDLTEAVEWEPASEGLVFCHRGRLEAIAAGEAKLAARYRAAPQDDYVTAETVVRVIDERYQAMELAVQPSSIAAGKAGQLDIHVVTDSGEKRSVLNSSQLRLEVVPPQLANLEADFLHAIRVGRGTLNAAFGELKAEREFQVTTGDTEVFDVKPKTLQLVTGESVEIQVVSSGTQPLRVVTSNPAVADVLPETRIVGRAPGTAEITVHQEAFRADVQAEVSPTQIRAIRFAPERIAVPVEGTVVLRLVGQCDEGQEVELAADAITWEQRPASAFAELDDRTMQVRGRSPTGRSPQVALARWGELRAKALIDVVAPPLQMELTPDGPLQLSVGQAVRLRASARYAQGRRVEIAPERLEWKLDPTQIDGLILDRGQALVRATRANVGPLAVRASYQGSDSNPVLISSSDAPVSLSLRADRSPVLVGDSGRLQASAADPAVTHLLLEGLEFVSKHPEILAVDRRNGSYRALQSGTVTVAVRHPQAPAPATAEIEVLEAKQAQLKLRPAEIKLMVGGMQPLELYLVTGDGEQRLPWLDGSREIRVGAGRPDAVRWQPPLLVGAAPAEPFEVTATWGGRTARAVAEVVPSPAAEKSALRVQPASVTLASGQVVSPRVEQRLPGPGETWVELEPSLVRWDMPDTVLWTPPSVGLRPQLTPAATATGGLELTARYAGLEAKMAVAVNPTAEPPSGPLEVEREPPGEFLAEGQRQRYAIVAADGSRREPAADIQWQPPFENDYVRWDPPVLTAKRRGHEQPLEATVAGQRLSFRTRTVAPPPLPGTPAPPPEAPREVRIVSGQTPPVILPVRASFGDFRVEAVFPSGPPIDVTPHATLHVDGGDPAHAPVVVHRGRLLAQRPGKAVVQAEYLGVRSTAGLPLEVVERPELTALEIVPHPVELRVGQRTRLQALGFTGSGENRRSLGDIAAHPDLVWRADDPLVVQVAGPVLTGLSPGETTVTAVLGDVSAAAGVSVPEPGHIGIQAVLRPDELRLQVGETKWMGRDVTYHRGAVDLSETVDVVSSVPDVVRYHPENRSIEGISPGEAELIINDGDVPVRLPVVVEPYLAEEDGVVVIEPSGGALAVGESLDLQVLLITASGQRMDRTGSAILQSDNPEILAVRASRIIGLAPGQGRITARLPGIADPGAGMFSVIDEPFTSLEVLPSSLAMAVGEQRRLQVVGVGPGGRRDLSGHPDVRLAAEGESPGCIDVRGAGDVRGAMPGKAAVRVTWRDLTASPVTVEVVDAPLTGLTIEPRDATVQVGDRARFVVSGRRGGQQISLSADDGVELHVADTAVAVAEQDLRVAGTSPGTTEVTARLGSQRASARLIVTPRDRPDSSLGTWDGLRFLPDVLALQLGVPGAPIRIVRTNAQGDVEDVAHQARIEIADPEIVQVNPTAAGPVFHARSEGQTEATASLGNLTSRRPLQIVVVDPERDPPRLEVRPDPLRLTVGGTGEFRRVRLVPSDGRAATDVDYQVESRTPDVVTVEPDNRTLRGVAAGQGRVRVVPRGLEAPFEGLEADVFVQVDPPSSGEPQLVLTGPSRTTVGAEVDYQVELVAGSQRRDVAQDGAQLVLDRDLAELRPGCGLLAREAGSTNVRARYRDQVSNVLPLQIDEIGDLDRLELEIEQHRLTVGEARPYKLWGHPVGGGPRQDLTARVTGDGAGGAPRVGVQVVQPDAGADIVAHEPPALVAKAPGQFRLAGAYGPLRTEIIDLEILPPDAADDSLLSVVPPAVTIDVGEQTPRLHAVARPRQGQGSRRVDAQWTSEDESVAQPDPAAPGRFTGVKPGKTRLKASFQGQEAYAELAVTGDPFQKVELSPIPEALPGNRFRVMVEVTGSIAPEDRLEYRIALEGADGGEGPWKAVPAGTGGKIELQSPGLGRGPPRMWYNLMLEARDPSGQTVARYPLKFQLEDRVQQESKPGAGAD